VSSLPPRTNVSEGGLTLLHCARCFCITLDFLTLNYMPHRFLSFSHDLI
jgi:hypothetical protein